jgi:uncharacterized UBP type Zn finger protein
MSEENLVYCINCKDHVKAHQQKEIWSAPNVLVLHLKRFSFPDGHARQKMETSVDFPLDNFDVGRWCQASNLYPYYHYNVTCIHINPPPTLI